VFPSTVFAENIYGKTLWSPVKPIAGNGTDGFGGDGGQATAAELSQPAGVVFDCAANFYIADSGNHRIRRVENPCGNGAIDTGEQCDDGNRTGGDGCGPRCLRECGNGVVDPGEECDDANWSDADCCLSTCRLGAAGTPCDADGDLCAAAFCDANGSCRHDLSPGMNCWKPSGSGRSSLLLKEGASDAGDRVSWSWAGRLANFGNPRGDTSYALCVYDDATGPGPARLRLRLDAPATPTCHEGCWFRTRKGWNYVATHEQPDGVDSVRLEARGFRRAHLTFVGSGAHLGPLGLPYTPGVTVQLRASTGQCWETDFSRPARNNPARFRARAGR